MTLRDWDARTVIDHLDRGTIVQAREFAKTRGWLICRKPFSWRTLAKGERIEAAGFSELLPVSWTARQRVFHEVGSWLWRDGYSVGSSRSEAARLIKGARSKLHSPRRESVRAVMANTATSTVIVLLDLTCGALPFVGLLLVPAAGAPYPQMALLSTPPP
jgi:hypothetical protein